MIDWQLIETAPRDGTMILVYFDAASVDVVHIAWWDSDEDVGWWSYVLGSVSQEKLDDYRTPTHWAPYNSPATVNRE